ncbi:MAG: NADH-quinone oxidoreductase subunit J family protein, partial [Phycisphaerales bacterium]
MDAAVSPLVLYGACAVGALGVLAALPKPKFSPFIVGAVVAAAAFGLLMLVLGLKYPGQIPNYNFYIFSVLALGSALRVITHPRPIYSALYFIMTILASCGLYLILSAEFMTFALVIVYAGAILITYLFVIMLATEGPSEEAVEALTEYDRVAREPVIATIAGFLLLGALAGILSGGAVSLKANPSLAFDSHELAVMPARVEEILKAAKGSDGEPIMRGSESIVFRDMFGKREPAIDWTLGTIVVRDKQQIERVIPRSQWPETMQLSNIEGVAMTLIEGHPLSIEVAGVILLMAMLGAVVLARKKVEMDEAARLAAVAREHAPARADML